VTRNRKPPAPADQPRPSPELTKLRGTLGLNDEDWRTFLRHARRGFSDFERANFTTAPSFLRIHDIPAEWYEDIDAIGYIFLHAFHEGETSLAVTLARHFLQSLDPTPGYHPVPPGTGLAWLCLARSGVATPIEAASLIYFALDKPQDFFHGVSEDDLPALCRLILEGRGEIQAWDLHAVLAAVGAAQIHVRAPFRLFDRLMTADWLSTERKQEFCRGLAGSAADADRLGQRYRAVRAAFQAHGDNETPIPRTWLELFNEGAASRFPTLKRHAVFALVENIGEPLTDVIGEYFLKNHGGSTATEAVSEGILDLIGLHAEELGPEVVRKLIGKAIKRGLAPVRQAAYRIGAERFGLAFVRPALTDDARIVRDWAARLLKTKKLQPARKTTSKRRSGSSPL
jgi:hypothetical protein